MKKPIPRKIYLRIAAQLPFFFILIWFLIFRLLTFLFIQTTNLIVVDIKYYALATTIFSIIVCILVMNPSIEREMETIDEPFSLVARDPNIPLKVDKITLKVFLSRFLFSIYFALLVSVPLILIGLVNLIAGNILLKDMLTKYGKIFFFYFICWFLIALLAAFLYRPLTRNRHWTKHQFS